MIIAVVWIETKEKVFSTNVRPSPTNYCTLIWYLYWPSSLCVDHLRIRSIERHVQHCTPPTEQKIQCEDYFDMMRWWWWCRMLVLLSGAALLRAVEWYLSSACLPIFASLLGWLLKILDGDDRAMQREQLRPLFHIRQLLGPESRISSPVP